MDIRVIDQVLTEDYSLYHADTCEAIKLVPTNSVHFTVTSPPFASLFCYSDSDRDLGNVTTHDEFHKHFSYLVPELLRITKPGRLCSIHCMDLPTTKQRDGFIGLTDFPGILIRAFQEGGWIWHSKVTIWTDPVVAMQRTKALGLLFKQLKKDSSMSRQGIPDYVLTFRKPGANEEPITHTAEEYPVSVWQRMASPIWLDILRNDTLQHRSVKMDADEAHVCPLQLEVIRRVVQLWSNPGDVVFDPFGGIGSTPYIALSEARRGLAVELKSSYYAQMVANCANAVAERNQPTLFDLAGVG